MQGDAADLKAFLSWLSLNYDIQRDDELRIKTTVVGGIVQGNCTNGVYKQTFLPPV